MRVILTEKVKTLGNVGDLVNVSAGYARNYLIPNNFAVVADESNKKQLDHQQKMLAKKVGEEKATAEATAKKVNGLNLDLIKKVGANGKLFGSVTTVELAKVLGEQGVELDRRQLILETPIKAVGKFSVKAKVFAGVEAEFTVEVKMDPKQVEENKKKAEELAAKKAADKAAQEAAAAEGETEEGSEKKELTEEEKLKQEANKILRSY